MKRFLVILIITLVTTVIPFTLTVYWMGSAFEDFGIAVTLDDEAEADIRHEFGDWIPDSFDMNSCAFASIGFGGDHGEHAVFCGKLDHLTIIAENFSGRSINTFDTTYNGTDRAVLDLQLDFPNDRLWRPASIKNGRFCEIQEWSSSSSGRGRFVAIDYSKSQIFLLKWIE